MKRTKSWTDSGDVERTNNFLNTLYVPIQQISSQLPDWLESNDHSPYAWEHKESQL